MFRIWVFFPDTDQTFFLSPDPDPDRPKSQIRISKKKRPKTGVKVEKMLYFISSTLNTVFFGQAPPKPCQNHHLEHVSL